jgi:serine/threonine-protein kinase
MELVPGESLAERLERDGPFHTTAALPLVQGMVAALAAAHRVGVVHRDFKCDNVMLATSAPEAPCRVVVMDFGLARVSTGLSSARMSDDSKGLVGTMAYMAPEQVQGRPVSAATDIYALGVVMFEMVTGRLPFIGDSPIDAATKRLVEPAPAASALVPGLDARWDGAIRRCLERDPAQRFSRAEEVAEALAGPSVAAAVPLAPRRPRRLITATVVAACLILATAGMLRARRLRPPHRATSARAESATSPRPESAPAPALAAPPAPGVLPPEGGATVANAVPSPPPRQGPPHRAPRRRAADPAKAETAPAASAEATPAPAPSAQTSPPSPPPAPAESKPRRRSQDPEDGLIRQ